MVRGSGRRAETLGLRRRLKNGRGRNDYEEAAQLFVAASTGGMPVSGLAPP
jgi:hypothetical protein